ncbi:hypothetical protein CAPTEDRAFT_185543 [Capitella teleta]|uniref:WWE domain-containing protein n=1 Tax=Capitella teleta TaxID=283909 RepID=R7VD36_CAPTE|nr:hypothetical protein CAPTEDRAFT_185543 [Capitella teleta]|eukprot:ELU13600.1 hypothetical protein CAPTEDRAFT_185543 [Capitella teleta]
MGQESSIRRSVFDALIIFFIVGGCIYLLNNISAGTLCVCFILLAIVIRLIKASRRVPVPITTTRTPVPEYKDINDPLCRIGAGNLIDSTLDGSDCRDLHICKNIVRGVSSFGRKCKKSHDFEDKDTLHILRKHGLQDCSELKRRIISANLGRKTNRIEKRNETTQESEEHICVHALKRQCKFGEKCRRVHSSEPYQWQYEGQDGQWINVPDKVNDLLQKKYVVPGIIDCTFSMKIGGEVVTSRINFTTMQIITNGYVTWKVRLVTTPSSARSISMLATEWLWFWKDEYGKWNEYGIARDGLDKAGISSKDIEKAYAENQYLLNFKTRRFVYEIDLLQMEQRNLGEGTNRPVCRRLSYRLTKVKVDIYQEDQLRKATSTTFLLFGTRPYLG